MKKRISDTDILVGENHLELTKSWSAAFKWNSFVETFCCPRLAANFFKEVSLEKFWLVGTKDSVVLRMLSPLCPASSFLPLISAPTGFHDWGLLTRWAQLLITSNYYLPSTPKDQSTMRAELTE